jgi:hypothetical protein
VALGFSRSDPSGNRDWILAPTLERRVLGWEHGRSGGSVVVVRLELSFPCFNNSFLVAEIRFGFNHLRKVGSLATRDLRAN